MEFIKLFITAIGVITTAILAINLVYWFFLSTRVGTYALAIVFIGLIYGMYKVLTLDKPKEKIW